MSPHRAFSLIELLVVISIIAVLAAMIMPAISLVREGAKRVTCGTRLRALAAATIAYSTDNEGLMPGGGGFNFATHGHWWSSADVTQVMGYLHTTASNTTDTTRAVRCPANPKGLMYPYWAGIPSDHPSTIGRLIACAKRFNVPGGQPALWTDACNVYDDGGGHNFANGCGHKGKITGPTSGVPAGGNISFTDGSVAWGAYLGDVAAPEGAAFIHNGAIGNARAVPNSLVMIRLGATGELYPNPPNNLIFGRTDTLFTGNF